jgi:hypothetical protein
MLDTSYSIVALTAEVIAFAGVCTCVFIQVYRDLGFKVLGLNLLLGLLQDAGDKLMRDRVFGYQVCILTLLHCNIQY